MTHVGPVTCPILVGRDDLLELADRRLAEVVDGHGQLLLLAGEAGIGKTRLLDAVRRKSRVAGFIDANGSLAPQDREVPAALILDLARTVRRMPAFGDLGDDLLAMRGDRDADALGSRRLYVIDVVDRIAAAVDRPVLLDFEDLQWADEISLEILGELARRARELPLFLVGAYRTEELAPGSFFREWRARLIGQRLAEEARLTSLTYEQTALMTTLILSTGLPAPREVVAAVHQRTDGVPLHIEELLGALGEEARSDGMSIREAEVPETIEDAVLTRIAQLSPGAREVARAGAVIGRCFVPEVLAGIMDRPVADLDAPLEELIDHAYLLPPGARGVLDFRHQLIRDVLYGTVPAVELRRLHARAGEFGAALEGQSEIHASVHFERAGLRAQAFRAALSGARAAARLSSHREAFELFQRAVANAPADLPGAERAQLLAAYSLEATAIEENAIAEAIVRESRECYLGVGNLAAAAGLVSTIGTLMRRAARPVQERIDVMRAGLTEADALPPGRDRDAARAKLLIVLAYAESDAFALADARSHVREGRRLAEAVGDSNWTFDGEWLEALIEALGGPVDAGVAAIADVATRARAAGTEDAGVSAYREAADLAVRSMDYRGAERLLFEGLRYADSIEQSFCAHVMTATSAIVAWAGGRWDDAVALGEQAISDRGCRRAATMARWPLGFVALGRGDVNRARSVLDAAADVGMESGAPDLILPAAWGRAEMALQAGDAHSAIAGCALASSLAEQTGERALFAPFVVTGVRAHHLAGDPAGAERWLERCTELLTAAPTLSWPAIDHGRGLVALAAGSTGVARGALEAAVRGWDERGRAWESAWARLDLASCLIRSNRVADAAALVVDVAATSGRLRSQPLLARVEELQRIVRGHGTTEEPWRPLTAREFEVARLIRDGLTNGEIGGELGIATKTVSAHVEHILAKLGVARRAEVAAWAASVTRSRAGATPEAVGAGRR